MSELILIRHGEPELAGAYIGQGSNPPLSEKGKTAAAMAAAALREEGPLVIYTSPLERTMQTVKPIADLLHVTPIIAEELSEMNFGEWEGLTWEEAQERDPETWGSWLDHPWRISPPGGETLEALSVRVVDCVKGILKRHESQEKILICTHGGPIRVILGHLLALKPSAFWAVSADYTCLFRFRQCSGRLKLLQWNIALDNGG